MCYNTTGTLSMIHLHILSAKSLEQTNIYFLGTMISFHNTKCDSTFNKIKIYNITEKCEVTYNINVCVYVCSGHREIGCFQH